MMKHQFSRGLRVVLKHTLNRLTRRLSRAGIGPFALVLHVGRRSGKRYETPLLLGSVEGGFVAELTYGPHVDWYQNVLAAGGCQVLWRRKSYKIDQVTPIDRETGRAAFPFIARVLLRLLGMKHFVRLGFQSSQD